MIGSAVWVLVADDRYATIRASTMGVSHQIQAHSNDVLPGKSISQLRGRFARALMLELCRGALNGAYSGLIIVAEPEIMEELQQVMPSNVARLLIAELPKLSCDIPDFAGADSPVLGRCA